MAGRSRTDRNDVQSDNRNAGYESRFGRSGMKGSHRFAEFEPETYGAPHRYGDEPVQPRRPAHGDYSTFEGTQSSPYYGGEEGNFPYGGTGMGQRGSFNADERMHQAPHKGHAGKGPKGYRRSDERMLEEVCDILTEHGDIDASQIEVDVKDSIVILKGMVENRRIKRLAEDAVEGVAGVRDVRNELEINEASFQSADLNRTDRYSESPQSSAHTARGMAKDRASKSGKTKVASSRQISQ